MYRSNSHATGWLFMLGLLALACASCSQPSEPRDARSEAATPPESFEHVMQRFRRAVGAEDGRQRLVAEEGDGVATFQYHHEVTHVLHEPQATGQSYTAEVTVTTTTHYAVRTPVTAPPEKTDQLVEEAIDPEVLAEIGEQEQPKKKQPQPGEYESSLRSDQFVDTYDMAYEKGRWVLKSHVENESIKLAFDYALKDQPVALPAPQRQEGN